MDAAFSTVLFLSTNTKKVTSLAIHFMASEVKYPPREPSPPSMYWGKVQYCPCRSVSSIQLLINS
ncbi:wsv071 [White spot syndrome virus]|uniref:Wsv071 n=4 Tax=White spot syndrome virus TaxID=342409 RepID=Q8VBA5_WSSVS|nr:wsv071 [Shrimp white spot syndrome virus]AFX59448.1 wsv071 [White spot syndrome virus]AAL33075.1 wsv071 [Shrimp white spot syndrome virus]AAL88996.1 WSSV128 [Shrimp white spot syndrome virus]AWQ60260.1 wsv071 [Shrimp white spot syndrome virus]AWQ60677.1 wsv071 [Shrimp white spot syndrome virus]